MADLQVSNDIDTFLQAANKSAARTALDLDALLAAKSAVGHTHLVSALTDASANGQSLLQSATYSEMMELLLGTLPTTDPGIIGKPWIDQSGFVRQSLGTTNLYQVRGFTDSNYFLGPGGAGLSNLGTVRVIAKVLSVPSSGQKVVLGRFNPGGLGWYFNTGLLGAGDFGVVVGTTGGVITLSYGTLGVGDVGKVVCLHATAQNAGSFDAYLGGILASSTSIATLQNAGAGDGMIVGRLAGIPGYSNPDLAIIDIATSTSVMTPQQIFDDAAQAQSRTANFRITDLPSQLHRFNADDIVSATDWISRSGSLTLTRNGTLTVEAY